jgi:hypothetical protein
VPAIQALEEIERLTTPDLADQNAIGPMLQRGPQQVANADRQQAGMPSVPQTALEIRRVNSRPRVFDQDLAVFGCKESDRCVTGAVFPVSVPC